MGSLEGLARGKETLDSAILAAPGMYLSNFINPSDQDKVETRNYGIRATAERLELLKNEIEK